jgi:hypothetical protein
MRELTIDELKKGVRNPFYHKLNKEVVVPVRNEVYEVFAEIAKLNGEEPEKVMRRCLADYAKSLQEHN